MTKTGGLARIRRRLDEAITHGRFKLARRLILEGLRRSEEGELLGEMAYFRGQREILNEDFHKAAAHFERAIRSNPGDGAAYNDLALCRAELGLIDEALFFFERGIAAEPDYATVYHNKGWLLNKIGRHREALVYFRKALKIEPRRAVTYENLADTMANLAQYKRSLEAYRKAIAVLKPGYRAIRRQIIAQMNRVEEKVSRPG